MVLTQVTMIHACWNGITWITAVVGGSCLDFGWLELVDEANTILS